VIKIFISINVPKIFSSRSPGSYECNSVSVLRRSGFPLLDNGINARIIGDSRFRVKKNVYTPRHATTRRDKNSLAYVNAGTPMARASFIKKAVGRSPRIEERGDIPSPFYRGPLSCRNYNCYRHYRMRYAHDAFGGRGNPSPLFVARPVLIENVKAAEKTYVSPECRSEKYDREAGFRGGGGERVTGGCIIGYKALLR